MGRRGRSCVATRMILLLGYDSSLRQMGSMPIQASVRTAYGAAADLARLDLDEEVPNSVRPGHRARLPGRCEQIVMSQRLSESDHRNAPARLALFIDFVNLESDRCSPDELSQGANGRSLGQVTDQDRPIAGTAQGGIRPSSRQDATT